MHEALIGATTTRRGHFLLESGHHGDLWLDLELLCLRPRQIERSVAELARRLSRYAVDAVCGPLNEGAFVALMVASHLDVEFHYAERLEPTESEGLFTIQYRIPRALRDRIQGKRVAVVNDVTNAGSAVRGTHVDVLECGAIPVALGSLVVLGDAAARFAHEQHLPLVSVAQLANQVWTPAECPLCASGLPLERV